MMRRRTFIMLIGGAAVVWPVVARTQQAAMPVVGFVNGGSPEASARNGVALRQGLKRPVLPLYFSNSPPCLREHGTSRVEAFAGLRAKQAPFLSMETSPDK
jgi:hypothetical protein